MIKDARRDDIGLGGLGTLVGLGFKKSWISTKFPGFTPLSASGYLVAGALAYHYLKMRVGPIAIDGDSSLVTLQYITHYLKQSHLGRLGNIVNFTMLTVLLWGSFYHVISGLFKYRRHFSIRAKRIAYGMIGTLGLLSHISVQRFRLWDLDTGFIGEQFKLYLYAT